jgi:putative ABC transport system permease protein
MASGERFALLDGQVAAGGVEFGPEGLLALDLELADGFAPITVTLRDPGTRDLTEVTVIGQLDDSASIFFSSIMLNLPTMSAAFADGSGQVWYVRTSGVDSRDYARDIEAALAQASAESLDKLLDDQQAASGAFLLLFQGFMGLGLVVGIAALGVIAFRAVVERRQQIGMLRAIGYQRSMVAWSFLLESGFVALSGILMGLVLGVSFAWVLWTSGGIDDQAGATPFSVPWLQIAIICGIGFGSSLLMTYFPARAASRVEVAEALRYE